MNGPSRTVTLIGWSGSGKSRTAARLIAHFRGKGYHVGAVKKSGGEVELDRPGSDSDLLRRSGACETALLAPNMSALMFERQLHAEEILQHFNLTDLVVSEGLPLPGGPLLEVAGRKTEEEGLKSAPGSGFPAPDAYIFTAPLSPALFPEGAVCYAAEDFFALLDFLEEQWNARSPLP